MKYPEEIVGQGGREAAIITAINGCRFWAEIQCTHPQCDSGAGKGQHIKVSEIWEV